MLGSVAIEGPIISWVADHRKHHTFSDQEGDPHSPHVGHGGGLRGALRGLLHAHVGWLFIHTQRGARKRYARDLIEDPVVQLRRPHLPGLGGGRARGMAFALGWAIGGSLYAALTGLLWGGAVRMLVVHHVTFSINSLCHFFGRRRFETDDESRNLLWLAPFTFGESWHNNHHAFPTSAEHGMRRWEIDPSALVIRALEKVGLVWDVVRVDRERQERRKLLLEEERSESAPPRRQRWLSLQLLRSVRTLTAFGPLSPGLRLVLHARALGERAEAVGLDVAVVHEQVLARLVGRNEAEALVVTEPLNGSCSHGFLPRLVCCGRGTCNGWATTASACTACSFGPTAGRHAERCRGHGSDRSALSRRSDAPRENRRSGEKRVERRTKPSSSAITRVQSP